MNSSPGDPVHGRVSGCKYLSTNSRDSSRSPQDGVPCSPTIFRIRDLGYVCSKLCFETYISHDLLDYPAIKLLNSGSDPCNQASKSSCLSNINYNVSSRDVLASGATSPQVSPKRLVDPSTRISCGLAWQCPCRHGKIRPIRSHLG